MLVRLENELVPFAADFHDGFLVGRLPDGRQFFARDPGAGWYAAGETAPEQLNGSAFVFGPNGDPLGRLPFAIPGDLRPDAPPGVINLGHYGDRIADLRRQREAHLWATLGFEPSSILVGAFDPDE